MCQVECNPFENHDKILDIILSSTIDWIVQNINELKHLNINLGIHVVIPPKATLSTLWYYINRIIILICDCFVLCCFILGCKKCFPKTLNVFDNNNFLCAEYNAVFISCTFASERVTLEVLNLC